MKQQLQNKTKKMHSNRGMVPFLDKHTSHRDFLPEIREFMNLCCNYSHPVNNSAFRDWIVLERGWRVTIAALRASLDMLYKVKIRRSDWSVHPANILPFQKFVDQMNFLCMWSRVASIKRKPGPSNIKLRDLIPIPHSTHHLFQGHGGIYCFPV
ncbi:hypothetical protein TNCV_97531 [Trichonephila clavipes]|nr:hypothetical protein TNCV_97531 [Trichonephila clavipes]